MEKSTTEHIKDAKKTEPSSTIQKASEGDELEFYLSKLKDTSYYETYNHNYKWYTACEELGKIGKEAIPPLIEQLQTARTYEKSTIFYSLLLASQNKNCKELIGNDFVKVGMSADPAKQEIYLAVVDQWWNKHKDKF